MLVIITLRKARASSQSIGNLLPFGCFFFSESLLYSCCILTKKLPLEKPMCVDACVHISGQGDNSQNQGI